MSLRPAGCWDEGWAALGRPQLESLGPSLRVCHIPSADLPGFVLMVVLGSVQESRNAQASLKTSININCAGVSSPKLSQCTTVLTKAVGMEGVNKETADIMNLPQPSGMVLGP